MSVVTETTLTARVDKGGAHPRVTLTVQGIEVVKDWEVRSVLDAARLGRAIVGLGSEYAITPAPPSDPR